MKFVIYPISKKHFKTFKKECRKWADIFGLHDWDLHYSCEEDGDGDRAWIVSQCQDRICNIGMGSEWENTKPTEKNLKEAARHEVCEVLLTRLDTEAKSRYASLENINEARHAIIQRLLRLMKMVDNANGKRLSYKR